MDVLAQGANVQTIQGLTMSGRKSRNPQHSWHTKQRPWTIQPIAIAPVLPGESLKNMIYQCRAVTQPIKNPLIGWWLEHYWFYVKHRDLDTPVDFENMMLQYGYDMTSRKSASSAIYYHVGSSINWAELCLKRVTEEYFRDEGDAWNNVTIDGLPVAGVGRENWYDSLTDTTVMPDVAGGVTGNAQSIESLDASYQQWEFMRANQLLDMSYEDWLSTYGIRKKQVEINKPELLRYSRDWQYPSNTVNASTGVPTSAVSWAVSERADKVRLFREPGFIFGVQVARPKVYFNKQKGSLVDWMDSAFNWLPAIMSDAPHTSLKEFAAASGPLQGNTTNGYWVDLRDLFIYGDQFVNFAVTETDYGAVALPTTALQKKYPSNADADALFQAAAPANHVRTDGVVNLNIASHQKDMT